jgi:serine/threonine protein kinase
MQCATSGTRNPVKTGDHVQDGRGRTFQVGQLLGRGSWGKCYLVREETDGTEWVLKVPLAEDEVPREPPRLAEKCREIAREQGRLLEESDNDALVRIEGRFIADDGSPAILMPRYSQTLERRIADGCDFQEVLEIVSKAVDALATLGTVLSAHGALSPSNILVTEQGEVHLMDPLTPTANRIRAALAAREGYLGAAYLPPETRDEDSQAAVTVDTYALAMSLYRAAMISDDGKAPPPALPQSGLEKADLVVLKDRIHNRLKSEASNPRFHTRLSDRASAIVNRAVSVQTSPSPPYRFNSVPEFKQRLDEVRALIHPTVTQTGKLLLNRPPANTDYDTDEEVRFSCTVAASKGVETHDEIGCGLAVFDQDVNERLRNLNCSYTVDRHPSGRFRFSFRIADLSPGNYLVRLAFTIRDSGHEPITSEGEFIVRAAPGYVPPRTETERQPLPLTREDGATGSSEASESFEWDTEDHTNPPTAAPTAAEPTPAAAAPEIESVPQSPARAVSEPVPVAPAPVPVAPEPVPVAAAAVSSHEPAPNTHPGIAPTDEPEYTGAGRWSELPLPGSEGEDLPAGDSDFSTSRAEDPGPIGTALRRAMDIIRGDAYLLFIGGASLIIVLLLAALWLLPS